MPFSKRIKDCFLRALSGKDFAPRGLVEINRYFRIHGPIHFDFKEEGGVIIGISKDFKYGSIITSGKSPDELDKNIKDAILTSFEIPSSYSKEAAIKNLGKDKMYAIA